MTNVISINCTCDYLVKRAARHRRSGRYDEAMTLLWKARNQFGPMDEVLWEMAQIYDEIGSEDDAEKTYLRLVRILGMHRGEALFHLAISSAQRGDDQRALSYFESFRQSEQKGDITPEMSAILARQLHQETQKKHSFRARSRAKALEKRAAACLQSGRVVAAQRAMEHALMLRPTARGFTMLACCHLLRMEFDEAIESAKAAHEISPSHVQMHCVLADAYMAVGEHKEARNAIYLAALRAREMDDMLAVCVESAKAGCDALTLRLTSRMLKRSPFHTRAMMIRACALINLGRKKDAERLLARLCVLLPENIVCESYYHLLREQKSIMEHLSLGVDLTHDEGVNRAAELITFVYADPKTIDEDGRLLLRVCRMCEWAFYSPMAGPSTKMAALALLAGLQAEEAKGILLDALLSPKLSDLLKLSVLQVLTARDGFHPYDVDMGGKLVRLAAGGVSTSAVRPCEANSRIVQRVADRLMPEYKNAAQILLNAYLAYVDTYGQPDKKHEDACAAALECWYVRQNDPDRDIRVVSSAYAVSARMANVYLQRIETCLQKQEKSQQGE